MQLLEKGGADLLNLEQTEWVPFPKPLVIDSGAGETVMPASWMQAHPIEASPGQGKDYYIAANGKEIHNEGQRRLLISNLEGHQTRQMTFQVADVKKALGSVNSICKAR